MGGRSWANTQPRQKGWETTLSHGEIAAYILPTDMSPPGDVALGTARSVGIEEKRSDAYSSRLAATVAWF